MADNYIERKFEEYRNGGIKTVRGPKKERAVFIADGLSPEGEADVKKYSAMPNLAVAFCGADRKRGNALAQATGSRFYLLGPFTVEAALADARAHWPSLEMSVL